MAKYLQSSLLVILAFVVHLSVGTNVTIHGIGKVQGQSLNSTGRLVDAFWGIPFAKPPIGNLRFAPPQPAEPWSGVRSAAFQLFFCPQYVPLKKQSTGTEDCLYLNIFRPQNATANKLPVMVWVHGGSYVRGSGSLYNGEILAAKHDVLVVTINYRLGTLGFFNIPGTNLTGNYGLLDQILALKWVKQHIGDFGGDANKVTIFGESAGAGSVSLLMLSSLTKGLFSRAIAESGSALNFWAILKTNKTQAERFATLIGCKDLKSVKDCLKKKTVQDILKWQKVHIADSTIIAPSMDKNIFSGFPYEQVKNEKLPVSNVDLMIGFNTDEGTMFMPNVTQWNKAYFESQIRRYLSSRYGYNNELETKLASFYYQSFVKSDSLNFRKGFKGFLDDYVFKEGIVKLALEWSKKHNNTYMYHFAYLPKNLVYPHWGVAHAIELDFVFGGPFLQKYYYLRKDPVLCQISNYTEEDKEMSLKVMKMWTDFAKTGNPGMGIPTINVTSGKYFEINRNVTVKEHYDPKMMAFWNDYVPEIVKMKGSTKNDCPVSASTLNYYKQVDGIVILATLFVGILMMMY